MRRKKQIPQNQKEVNFVPLNHDPERAKQLLIQLFEFYPFNTKHIKYDLYFERLGDFQYRSKIWENVWKNMYKSGHLTTKIIDPREMNDINEMMKRNLGVDDSRRTPSLIKNIINHALGKIKSYHTNWEYHETPSFVIFRDFIHIIFSYLLPNGKNWSDFLKDPFIGQEYYRYYYPLDLKEISNDWKEKTKKKSTMIREITIKEFMNISDFLFKAEFSLNKSIEELSKSKIFINLKEKINKLEKQESIPDKFQSSMVEIINNVQTQLGKDFNISSPCTVPPKEHQYSQKKEKLWFGVNFPKFIDFINIFRKDYEKYEYKLDPKVEIILTSKQFKEQLNEILQLYFGHTNIQIDEDGNLRYLQTKYEAQQIHALIETFVAKNLSSLIPLLDKLIGLEEKGEWKEVVKYCRILFEDFIRAILKRKKIKFSSKSTLKPLITEMRSKKNKLFTFPKWILDDPFKNYDDYLLGLRFLADILNPNSHTDKINVSKEQSIAIKNSVISHMISLTGFLK